MMNYGFVPVATASPSIRVADPVHNGNVSYDAIKRAANEGAKLVVLPECTMTSYISNDFLYQDTLLEAAQDSLAKLIARTSHLDVVFIIGIPLRINCTLYNTAAVCHKGRILGIVPKTHIPTYGVDFEGRWFETGPAEVSMITIAGQSNIPFGSHQVFRNALMPELCIGVEICEDIWSPNPPSIHLALAGATVLCNCSASNASIEKAIYRRGLISGQSARLLASYIYCSSGNGDSTEDILVGGHELITENGNILAEAKPFGGGFAIAEVDVEGLCAARRSMSSFVVAASPELAGYHVTDFEMNIPEKPLIRKDSTTPFVPSQQEADERCELVTNIQAHGLAIKMQHASASSVTLKLTDGPDDMLALLLCAKTMDLMKLPHDKIHVFGSGDSMHLAELLNCTIHTTDEPVTEALAIGPYDMTRLAVGAAVSPDDMQLDYAINSCVARTLVPLLAEYLAGNYGDEAVKLVGSVKGASDIRLDEDCAPTEVIDFYLNCLLGAKDSPAKTLHVAKSAFDGRYTSRQLLEWLKSFYEAFFATQYMRRNLPDGPEVGSVNISPRGGFMMPARDAGTLWLEQVSRLKP